MIFNNIDFINGRGHIMASLHTNVIKGKIIHIDTVEKKEKNEIRYIEKARKI